jgi:DNA-binding CsgD family transcriptional regulator
MGMIGVERARDRILAADHDAASTNDVCGAALEALRLVVPFSWGAIMTVDHETLLPTGGVVEGFDASSCAPFWDNELLDPDFVKFRDLAASSDPICTLGIATDGALERSPRFQKLFAPLGAADELRLALVAGDDCIAVATLVRSADDGVVGDAELADVRAVLPTMTQVLRRTFGRIEPEAGAADSAPAVVLLDAEGRAVSTTVGGARLLDDLRTEGVDEDGVPAVILAAATRTRWSRRSSRLAHRVRGRSGRWMRVDVQPLDGDDEIVAVTITPARAGDLFPILLASYGFTERETAVTLLLVRGLTAKEIAADLGISQYTVRDHTKAVFEKAEVNSRGELVAKLFAAHVLEPFHGTIAAHR